MIPKMNNFMTASGSRQLQPKEHHEARRVVAVEGLQGGWEGIFAHQSSDPEFEMIGNRNIVDATNGYLIDREQPQMCSGLGHAFHHVLKKLILGYTLCPYE